jgi:hypothetical protein
MVAIKTHFDGCVFVPDEPVDLPRGQIAVLHALVPGGEPNPGAIVPEAVPPHPLPAGKSVWEWMAENPIDDPSLPADLSENLDHYLYGQPKQDGP